MITGNSGARANPGMDLADRSRMRQHIAEFLADLEGKTREDPAMRQLAERFEASIFEGAKNVQEYQTRINNRLAKVKQQRQLHHQQTLATVPQGGGGNGAAQQPQQPIQSKPDPQPQSVYTAAQKQTQAQLQAKQQAFHQHQLQQQQLQLQRETAGGSSAAMPGTLQSTRLTGSTTSFQPQTGPNTLGVSTFSSQTMGLTVGQQQNQQFKMGAGLPGMSGVGLPSKQQQHQQYVQSMLMQDQLQQQGGNALSQQLKQGGRAQMQGVGNPAGIQQIQQMQQNLLLKQSQQQQMKLRQSQAGLSNANQQPMMNMGLQQQQALQAQNQRRMLAQSSQAPPMLIASDQERVKKAEELRQKYEAEIKDFVNKGTQLLRKLPQTQSNIVQINKLRQFMREGQNALNYMENCHLRGHVPSPPSLASLEHTLQKVHKASKALTLHKMRGAPPGIGMMGTQQSAKLNAMGRGASTAMNAISNAITSVPAGMPNVFERGDSLLDETMELEPIPLPEDYGSSMDPRQQTQQSLLAAQTSQLQQHQMLAQKQQMQAAQHNQFQTPQMRQQVAQVKAQPVQQMSHSVSQQQAMQAQFNRMEQEQHKKQKELEQQRLGIERQQREAIAKQALARQHAQEVAQQHQRDQQQQQRDLAAAQSHTQQLPQSSMVGPGAGGEDLNFLLWDDNTTAAELNFLGDKNGMLLDDEDLLDSWSSGFLDDTESPADFGGGSNWGQQTDTHFGHAPMPPPSGPIPGGDNHMLTGNPALASLPPAASTQSFTSTLSTAGGMNGLGMNTAGGSTGRLGVDQMPVPLAKMEVGSSDTFMQQHAHQGGTLNSLHDDVDSNLAGYEGLLKEEQHVDIDSWNTSTNTLNGSAGDVNSRETSYSHGFPGLMGEADAGNSSESQSNMGVSGMTITTEATSTITTTTTTTTITMLDDAGLPTPYMNPLLPESSVLACKSEEESKSDTMALEKALNTADDDEASETHAIREAGNLVSQLESATGAGNFSFRVEHGKGGCVRRLHATFKGQFHVFVAFKNDTAVGSPVWWDNQRPCDVSVVALNESREAGLPLSPKSFASDVAGASPWPASAHAVYQKMSAHAFQVLGEFVDKARASNNNNNAGAGAGREVSSTIAALCQFFVWVKTYQSMWSEPCRASGQQVSLDPTTGEPVPPTSRSLDGQPLFSHTAPTTNGSNANNGTGSGGVMVKEEQTYVC